MRSRHLIVAATATLLATLAWGADSGGGRWLNMHVTDRGDETEVQLHMPVSLVLTVLESVDAGCLHRGRVQLDLDGADVDWMAVLGKLRNAREGELLDAGQPEADIRVTKREGTVIVDIKEHSGRKEHVEVRVPAKLLDALRVDADSRIDLKALLAELDTIGSGELLRVESSDADVRIWVE